MSDRNKTISKEGVDKVKRVEIRQLPNGRYCYFMLSDFFNLSSFQEISAISDDKMAEEVRLRLIISLILFDRVILHSSDIARSEMMYNIIKDYPKLVANEDIMFLFSNEVEDVERDFVNYLNGRRKSYNDNPYPSDKDEVSFLAIDNEDHMTDVLGIYLSLKKLLVKGYSGKDTFKSSIITDLSPGKENFSLEEKSNFRYSLLQSLNLTMYQLMSMKKGVGNIFDNKKVEKVCDDLNKVISSESHRFSCNGIMEIIKRNLLSDKEDNVDRLSIIEALGIRISYLYAKMNINDTSVFLYDYHPQFDSRSSYYLIYFKIYFKYIFNKDFAKIKWTQEKIILLKKDRNKWNKFVKEFLSSTAELMNIKNYTVKDEQYFVSQYNKNLTQYKGLKMAFKSWCEILK
ncbi:MAG: hypothetical protein R3Y65_08575 [Bacillota bacterium]